MTVLETLTAAADYLGKHSVESPRLNAEHLLAHTLGKKRLDLYLEFDRPLSDADRAPLRDLVRQRAQGKPLQHLLGTAEFFGHTFVCDGRALIPRPETEQLIEFALQYPKPAKVLDIGTGSGVIAITFALEFPDAEVFATDLHSEALSLAQQNAEKLGAKIQFSQADLLPAEGGPFDLIMANLPYIPAGEIPACNARCSLTPYPPWTAVRTASTSSGGSSRPPPIISHPEDASVWKSDTARRPSYANCSPGTIIGTS